ncbi:hypothetical protein SAMN05421803_101617 [Nocardiopsis flavescens]|uniref:Uncharacterized protein n=1 Tax=Nocardiopsis flavescens TaxID=758803 RepID=A0A1M6C8V4_9ACTN|nr:hypothetical protein [Nocardiopsis flavescens]SHI57178.1 hypothetical protein SAMN05421803_101617 [Nocardiopsis flavescens]
MRRERMRVPVTVHRERPGGGARVLRMAPGPGRLALHGSRHGFSMYADHAGAERLVGLWAPAARSPRSIVHLPLRAAAPPEGLPREPGEEDPPGLDLVLVHRTPGLPASAWKRLRARLDAGRPHTAVLPADALPEPREVDHRRRGHREYRDHLRYGTAARTLVVAGSGAAFRESGSALRGLLDEGPSYPLRYPLAGHYCVEPAAGPAASASGAGAPVLHVRYCDSWRL